MRLVVSPHLDDAALGAGSYLADSHDHVLTVFSGFPDGDGLSDYDRSCGFDSSSAAMLARALENKAALDVLGCGHTGLGLLDRQYSRVRPSVREVANRIDSVRRVANIEGLLAPLGVNHPDHLLISEACLVLANVGVPTWMYEELPYRVVMPEATFERHAALRDHGWHLVPDFLGGGPTDVKAKAIAAYASQRLDEHCCLVPERFFAVTSL